MTSGRGERGKLAPWWQVVVTSSELPVNDNPLAAREAAFCTLRPYPMHQLSTIYSWLCCWCAQLENKPRPQCFAITPRLLFSLARSASKIQFYPSLLGLNERSYYTSKPTCSFPSPIKLTLALRSLLTTPSSNAISTNYDELANLAEIPKLFQIFFSLSIIAMEQ